MSKRKDGYYWIVIDKEEEVARWQGDEWIICGLEWKSNSFTDDNIKYIDENIIVPEKNRIQSKGDYMDAVKLMDPRVREIDSAIPLELATELMRLGVDARMMVSVYWANGSQEFLNIAELHSQLENNK